MPVEELGKDGGRLLLLDRAFPRARAAEEARGRVSWRQHVRESATKRGEGVAADRRGGRINAGLMRSPGRCWGTPCFPRLARNLRRALRDGGGAALRLVGGGAGHPPPGALSPAPPGSHAPSPPPTTSRGPWGRGRPRGRGPGEIATGRTQGAGAPAGGAFCSLQCFLGPEGAGAGAGSGGWGAEAGPGGAKGRLASPEAGDRIAPTAANSPVPGDSPSAAGPASSSGLAGPCAAGGSSRKR